jgi:Mor family transcriptional regulator
MRHVLSRLKSMYPRSLLSEFQEVFGEKMTVRIIEVFSGTTLEIPSRRDIEIADRDITIYESLAVCTNSRQLRDTMESLGKRFNLSERRVGEVFRRMKKQLQENKRFKLADSLTGQLKKSSMQVKHESKRR